MGQTSWIFISVSAMVGVLIGVITGYFSGIIDLTFMRIIDIVMAFPGLLLALVIVSVLGSGFRNMVIALIIYKIPGFVRVSRGATLSVKNTEYVLAAKALGGSPTHIVFHHVIPNCVTSILVHLTISAGAVVLIASGLSFLGLGIQRPTPEWGLMLSDGRQYLRVAPHVSLVPGTAIMILILAFNLLGEGLTDLLNPA